MYHKNLLRVHDDIDHSYCGCLLSYTLTRATHSYVLLNAVIAIIIGQVQLLIKVTATLCRSILLCFDALSWLAMDHGTQQRRSCLPLHLFTLSKLYHLFTLLEQCQ